MEPSKKVSITSPTARKKTVMEKLTALQNGHRLAIHVIEHDGCHFTVLDGLMKQLKQGDTDDVAKKLLKYAASEDRTHYPVHSTSLLPPDHLGWSMHPYEVSEDALDNYGYLFNLSQDLPDPPAILSADAMTFDSGGDYSTKLEMIAAPECDAVKKVYDAILERHPSNGIRGTESKRLIQAMCGPNRAHFANQMLDALGTEALWQGYDFHEKHPQVADYNEVIIAAGARHISAITVPIFQSPHSVDKTYPALRKLQAALVGLNHLEAGMDLPVVLYHITPPNKGALSYVGQGKEELHRAGLEALKEMAEMKVLCLHDAFNFQTPPRPHPTELLTHNVKRHLGVDISVGETGTAGWYVQVDEQLAILAAPNRARVAPEPALPPHRTWPA